MWVARKQVMQDLNVKLSRKIAMAKNSFQQDEDFFSSKLNANLRKKLVKCYMLSIALYGAETWTLQKVDQKYLESFEMW